MLRVKNGKPVGPPLRPAVIDKNVLALHVAELTQPLPKGLKEGATSGRCEGTQVTYPWYFLRLLRFDEMDGSESQTDQ